MHELTELVVEAWGKVRAGLSHEEIRRRLARRKSRTFTACPRAWCLVVRACDRRINEYYGWENLHWAHDVALTSDLVRGLVKPVRTERPYSTKAELARELGVSPGGLRNAVLRGHFEVRRIPLLGGQRGHAVPVVSSKEQLDPAGRHFQAAHPIWTTQWKYLSDHVPDGIEQWVRRVPVFRRGGLSPAGWRARGPVEYRPVMDPLARDRWTKDGEYIFTEADRRLARERENARRRRKERRLENDMAYERYVKERTAAQVAGREEPAAPRDRRTGRVLEDPDSRVQPYGFRGYEFVCPMCLKKVRKLYYPLPVYHAIKLMDEDYFEEGHEAALPACPGFFACRRCHRVDEHSLADATKGWNDVVTQLSAGLLYGREVPRPAWWSKVAVRKQSYAPKAGRPRVRENQVKKLLLRGHTRKEIARMMNITLAGVLSACLRLYKRHGVHSVGELAEVLGEVVQVRVSSKREVVRRLLTRGVPHREIGEIVGRRGAARHLSAIYKEHGVRNRRELAGKLGGESMRQPDKRNEIPALGKGARDAGAQMVDESGSGTAVPERASSHG